MRASRPSGAKSDEHTHVEVRAVTAPSNTGSIRFHQGLGFTVSEPAADYNGLGRAMVIFQRPLHQPSKVR